MKNLELGKQIWNILKTNLDFNSWYKDCFGSCIDDAANLIDSGCCTFEEGSELEISKTISKDGNTHTFKVDKENFIEYYGNDKCFEMFILEEYADKLSDFFIDTVCQWTEESKKKGYEFKHLYLNDFSYSFWDEEKITEEERHNIIKRAAEIIEAL